MIKLFVFDLPFRTPFVTSKGSFAARKGVVIEYTAPEYTAVAEVAPLPGFSTTDFDSICADLVDFKHHLTSLLDHISNVLSQSGSTHSVKSDKSISSEFNFSSGQNELEIESHAGAKLIDLVHSISEQYLGVDFDHLSPEIRFAVDSLILQLVVQHSTFDFSKCKTDILLNCTVNSAESAKTKYEQGYRTFKIKVGLNLEKEINLIRDVRDMFADVQIRLDANGAWGLNEAAVALNAFKDLKIQYMEQPVAENLLATHGEFLRSIGVPIAADESARDHLSISNLIEKKSVDVLIIKPTLIGSFGNLIEILKMSKDHALDIVFTSTLDSVINRTLISFMTASLSDLRFAQGLATGQLLHHDLTAYPDNILEGTLKQAIYDIRDLSKDLLYERLVRIA